MKTLIVFCPENAKNPHKSYKDFIVSNKRLRIIYYSENMSFLRLSGFKLSTKKLRAGADILHTDFAKNFKGNKIYKSGHNLAMYHLSSVIKLCDKNPDIIIFSQNRDDIYTLSDIIMTNKNIKFLTCESKVCEFNEALLSEFGISGGALSNCDLNGKIAIIMSGGESLLNEGAKKIINLSRQSILWQNISPQDISYNIPPSLKGIPILLKRGDLLETILAFLGIDFSYTKPFSLKINK